MQLPSKSREIWDSKLQRSAPASWFVKYLANEPEAFYNNYGR